VVVLVLHGGREGELVCEWVSYFNKNELKYFFSTFNTKKIVIVVTKLN
jgi:hypothetical protein